MEVVSVFFGTGGGEDAADADKGDEEAADADAAGDDPGEEDPVADAGDVLV